MLFETLQRVLGKEAEPDWVQFQSFVFAHRVLSALMYSASLTLHLRAALKRCCSNNMLLVKVCLMKTKVVFVSKVSTDPCYILSEALKTQWLFRLWQETSTIFQKKSYTGGPKRDTNSPSIAIPMTKMSTTANLPAPPATTQADMTDNVCYEATKHSPQHSRSRSFPLKGSPKRIGTSITDDMVYVAVATPPKISECDLVENVLLLERGQPLMPSQSTQLCLIWIETHDTLRPFRTVIKMEYECWCSSFLLFL